MPYSKKAKYYHDRWRSPNDFIKGTIKTVPLDHTSYNGDKYKGLMECGVDIKARTGKLKHTGKWSIQSILIPKIIAEEVKANKTNLNKIIKWSTSRFNEYRKGDVIEIILNKIKEGKDYKQRFGTGSFAESGSLAGWEYVFKIKNGEATLYDSINKKKFKLT